MKLLEIFLRPNSRHKIIQMIFTYSFNGNISSEILCNTVLLNTM